MATPTILTDFTKIYTTSATTTTFPSRIPTLTEPIRDGVFTLGTPTESTTSSMLVIPFGAGADNSTITGLRVLGWRKIQTLWLPVLLCEVSTILCATTGIIATPVLNTERFSDTIVLITGNANVSNEIISPQGDNIGHFVVDVKGFTYIEMIFDLGTATAANALVAQL